MDNITPDTIFESIDLSSDAYSAEAITEAFSNVYQKLSKIPEDGWTTEFDVVTAITQDPETHEVNAETKHLVFQNGVLVQPPEDETEQNSAI